MYNSENTFKVEIGVFGNIFSFKIHPKTSTLSIKGKGTVSIDRYIKDKHSISKAAAYLLNKAASFNYINQNCIEVILLEIRKEIEYQYQYFEDMINLSYGSLEPIRLNKSRSINFIFNGFKYTCKMEPVKENRHE